MTCRLVAVSLLGLLPTACYSVPIPTDGGGAVVTPASAEQEPKSFGSAEAGKEGDGSKDKDKDKAKEKAEQKKQKQKELRNKQRELLAAQSEQRVAEMDRQVRQMGVQAALQKTATELEHAKKELAGWLRDVKPRELDEKKLGLDQSTYRAEHSKDEYGELSAMYENDEFARTTKELVLKRGRRELESSERYLDLTKRENAWFETWTQPARERELKQKIADAELEAKKAEIEAQKAKLEMELQVKKGEERLSDLAEEIRELQETLAKEFA
jgi:hypothetical protein